MKASLFEVCTALGHSKFWGCGFEFFCGDLVCVLLVYGCPTNSDAFLRPITTSTRSYQLLKTKFKTRLQQIMSGFEFGCRVKKTLEYTEIRRKASRIIKANN
jgi:hypothetical protein